MKNRRGIFTEWMAVLFFAFLAIPLFGWAGSPRSSPGDAVPAGPAAAAVKQQTIPAQDSNAGNVERGRDLFTGVLHFQHESPPCMGCHNVDDNGLLGGGVMGPDLTNVSTQRTPEEIASTLSNSGPAVSPVMQPILAEHPLTESEQADLIAFLNASVGQPESNREFVVVGISLAGFAAAVALLGFVYRGRLRGVRRSLIKKAEVENQ